MRCSKPMKPRGLASLVAGMLWLVGCQSSESAQATEASGSESKAQQNGAPATGIDDARECSTSFHCEVGRYCSDEGRCVDDGAQNDAPK
jgi:hypothetical protein